MTVMSDTETIETLSGIFTNCLLMTLRIEDGVKRDEAPEHANDLNRTENSEIRQGWYAPGVGLIQMRARNATGDEVFMQLNKFELKEENEDYFPLSIGNAWEYVWMNPPAGWKRVDRYRVDRREGDRWYIRRYGYLATEELLSD